MLAFLIRKLWNTHLEMIISVLGITALEKQKSNTRYLGKIVEITFYSNVLKRILTDTKIGFLLNLVKWFFFSS